MYSTPKTHIVDDPSYDSKREQPILEQLIASCANNFYHKSHDELQEAINALEQGVDSAEKNHTVIELLKLLKEKDSYFMVERHTLINFFKKMQEHATVVENYKNGLSPQSKELNKLLSQHRAKFYHTSDDELAQAIEVLENGSLQQIETDPTITILRRALQLENGCNALSRDTAKKFFEQVSAAASIADRNDADNMPDEIEIDMTEDDDTFDLFAHDIGDIGNNDAVYSFFENEQAKQNQAINSEKILGTSGVSEFYKKSESSLQNTLYALKHGTKGAIENDSNVTALCRILKQQNNINSVTKQTLIGIFDTILDNRQELKELFLQGNAAAKSGNFDAYRNKKEEIDRKLSECHISKSSADHLKNILEEEDRKNEWKKSNQIDPEIKKLRNTLSNQQEDIYKKIKFLADTNLNWNEKISLKNKYQALQSKLNETIKMFNDFIDYENSEDSPREKVSNPLYKEYHNSERSLKRINEQMSTIEETNKELSKNLEKYQNIDRKKRKVEKYKRQIEIYENRIESHKKKENKEDISEITMDKIEQNIEIETLEDELKELKKYITDFNNNYNNRENCNYQEFEYKFNTIHQSFMEANKQYYDIFIKRIELKTKERISAVEKKITDSKNQIKRKLEFLETIKTEDNNNLLKRYRNLERKISTNHSSFKKTVSTYNKIEKINRNSHDKKTKFLEVQNNLEEIEDSLNVIEPAINEIDALEKKLDKNFDEAIKSKNEAIAKINELDESIKIRHKNLSTAINCVISIQVDCHERDALINKYVPLEKKLAKLHSKLLKYHQTIHNHVYANINTAIETHKKINNEKLENIKNQIAEIDKELEKISETIATKQALYRNAAKTTLEKVNGNSNPPKNQKHQHAISAIKKSLTMFTIPFKLIKDKINDGFFMGKNKNYKKPTIDNLSRKEDQKQYMMDLKTMFILDRIYFGKKNKSTGKKTTCKNQKMTNISKNHSSLLQDLSKAHKNRPEHTYNPTQPSYQYQPN